MVGRLGQDSPQRALEHDLAYIHCDSSGVLIVIIIIITVLVVPVVVTSLEPVTVIFLSIWRPAGDTSAAVKCW